MKPIHSLLLFCCLLLSSLLAGFGSYRSTRRDLISDLNQALVRTLREGQTAWVSNDTIRAYRQLRKSMQGPLVLNVPSETFRKKLNRKALQQIAFISVAFIPIHASQKEESATSASGASVQGLVSDTLLWLTPTEGEEVVLFVRSYTTCSFWTVLQLSDLRWALTLLAVALLWGGASFLYFRRRNRKTTTRLTFGNLSFSPADKRFYNTLGEEVKFTPMQAELLELFYREPTHELSKTALCETLWPGKDNAEETLYTLIRRLKGTLETYTNLHLSTDRGRSYSLKERETTD